MLVLSRQIDETIMIGDDNPWADHIQVGSFGRYFSCDETFDLILALDVLEHMGKFTDKWASMLPRVRARAKRYAAVQERLIAPDGTWVARAPSDRPGIAMHEIDEDKLTLERE